MVVYCRWMGWLVSGSGLVDCLVNGLVIVGVLVGMFSYSGLASLLVD